MADLRILSYHPTGRYGESLRVVVGRGEDQTLVLIASPARVGGSTLVHVRKNGDGGPLLIHQGTDLIYAIRHAVVLLNSGKRDSL